MALGIPAFNSQRSLFTHQARDRPLKNELTERSAWLHQSLPEYSIPPLGVMENGEDLFYHIHHVFLF